MNTLSKIFFPEGIKCIICDGELSFQTDGGVCQHCRPSFNIHFCNLCGRALKSSAKYCVECQSLKQNFEIARAPFVYEGGIKRLIHRLKFGNGRYLAPYLAHFMALACINSEITADFITFVPLHPRKRKQRGYNQAELLAREVGKLLDIPVADVFDKVKEIKSTAKMRKYQRKEIIRDSVDVMPGIKFVGQIVLLVDDVFTTGTTANECSGKLLAAGAESVKVVTFATSKIFENAF